MSDIIGNVDGEDLGYDDVDFEYDDDMVFEFHEPTPEEIEQNRKIRAIELEEKGFLPENEGYMETMSSPQEAVEKEPTRYIIQECIPACKELWKKNIYTFMVSDHLNEGVCWIEVIADSLSDENKSIYLNLSDEEAVKFSYHKGTVNFGVRSVGREGQSKLLDLAMRFEMQDVPYLQAYISPEDFLMKYCGCYEEYPNPDYRFMKAPWTADVEPSDMADYMEKYEQWETSIESKPTLRKYAPEKATKTIDEYVKDHEMILDEGRVYLSQFHYDKHRNYIDYINDMSSNKKISSSK